MKKRIIRNLVLCAVGWTGVLCGYTVSDKSPQVESLSSEIISRDALARSDKISPGNVLDANEAEVVELGRQYYRGLIEKAVERHWSIPIVPYASFSYKTFDCNGCCSSIAQSLFGSDVRIRDIFLLAKLAEANYVHIDQIPNLSDLPNYAVRRENSTDSFGWFADDIAVSHLAKVKVGFSAAEYYEYGANISAIYRFRPADSNNFALVFGVTLPIKGIMHKLDLALSDGDLFLYGFVDSVGVRQDPMQQFFKDYSGLEDFFIRAVLEPKGIKYEPWQNKFGIGDLAAWAAMDFGGAFKHVEGLQVGATIVFPTGKKAKGDTLWDIELGNGGAFQGNIFANTIINTRWSVLNPTVRVVGEISSSFNSYQRVSQIKSLSADAMVPIADTDIINPVPQLKNYWVAPFDERDSTVCMFADQAPCVRIQPGSRVIAGFGNYFENMFGLGLRLGLFYDFTYKSCNKVDSIKSACTDNPFDFCCLEKCTNVKAHRIGWILAYKFENMVELNVGSQHVVAGVNTPQSNEAFASLIAVF